MAKLFGVEFAPLNIPLSRRLQTLGVLHYITVFIIIPIVSIWFFVYVLLFSKYWWTVLLYAVWFWYDYDTPKRGGRKFGTKTFRRSVIWKWLRDYFPVNLHKTVDLDPDRNYIFGQHPHGIVVVGGFTNFATEANQVSKLFPGLQFHVCTLVGIFWIPFRREYTMLTGSIDVSKESIQWCLTRPEKGQAVVIVVGGVQEVLDARPGHYDLTLKGRKGFIKMALKHGADLVPVFSFGENDLYEQASNPKGSKLRRIQSFIKRYVGITIPLIHGRGVFNYTWGILPFRRPIHTVVGRPIRVEKAIPEPATDELNVLHERYIEGLVNLFEENKKKFGLTDEDHLTIF